jgi:hypothetical protein
LSGHEAQTGLPVFPGQYVSAPLPVRTVQPKVSAVQISVRGWKCAARNPFAHSSVSHVLVVRDCGHEDQRVAALGLRALNGHVALSYKFRTTGMQASLVSRATLYDEAIEK